MKGKHTKNISLTDWDRVNRLSDDQIDFSDMPETNDEFWKEAEVYMPPKKDSLINILKRYDLKSADINMIVRLVERLAH
jgi:hypothetical protein